MVVFLEMFRFKILFWAQWLAAGQVLLIALMAGANTGWLVTFIGRLVGHNPPFQVTREEITWTASLAFLSQPLGVIVANIIAYYYGSKFSLYISGLYYITAWTILAFANSIYLVMFSQIFCGIGMGTYISIYPTYIHEIADKKIRGALESFIMQGYVVGVLFGNLMGIYLMSYTFAFINLGPTVLYLITFFFFPHTPHHFIMCNKIIEADLSIRFYSRENQRRELEVIMKHHRENPRVPFLDSCRQLRTPVNTNTTIIVNILNSCVQSCGIFAVIEYMHIILTDGKVRMIPPAFLIVLMSIISLLACWLAISISYFFKRITIVFCSCIVLCLVFISFGVNFHLIEQGVYVRQIQWLVILCALILSVSINIGFYSTMPKIISEVYEPDVKNIGICINHITSSLCVFIISKNFLVLVDSLGYHYVFYAFAVIILALGVFAKTCALPEIKEKKPEVQARNHNVSFENRVVYKEENNDMSFVDVPI